MNNLSVKERSDGFYNIVCSTCGGTNFHTCTLFCKDCDNSANAEKTNIEIKRVGRSERCEICHQADMFSPEENICKRCQDIEISISVIAPKQMKQEIESEVLVMIVLVAMSIFLCIHLYKEMPHHLWMILLIILALISYNLAGTITAKLRKIKKYFSK